MDFLADQLPTLLGGLRTSAWLALISIVLGLPCGLLLGLLATSSIAAVRWATLVVVEVFRGIPMLLLVYFVYFGLPGVGLSLAAETALVVSLVVSAAAYTSEIFRAGLLGVARGHREAARSLGLTGFQELRHIVLPQALRAVRLPIISFSVLIFQYTSVGFAIGIPELLSRSYAIGSVTFNYLGVFVLAGALYATVAIAASGLMHLLRRDRAPQVLPF